MNNETAFDELVAEIEMVSEKYWCARWRLHIEYFVWDRLLGLDLYPRGNLPLLPAEIERLRTLHDVLAGWVVRLGDGSLRYCSDAEWTALHQRYRAGEDPDAICAAL